MNYSLLALVLLVLSVTIHAAHESTAAGHGREIPAETSFRGFFPRCLPAPEPHQNADQSVVNSFLAKVTSCIVKLVQDLLLNPFKKLLGHGHGGQHENGANANALLVISNWMNSFVYVPIYYANEKKAYNLVIDTINNYVGSPGNFLVGHCPKGQSCDRHGMHTLDPNHKDVECEVEKDQTSLDGKVIKLQICKAQMKFAKSEYKKASFMLINGQGFDVFNPMLDSGAPFGPKMDGVFSLALTENPEQLKSGIEYLFKEDEKKLVSIFIESFTNLNFFNKKNTKILIGQENSVDCQAPFHYHPSVDKNRWTISMDAQIHFTQEQPPKNVWEGPMTKQKAMISMTDSFIFAPKKFTDPLYENLTSINDNWLFQFARNKLGKPGVAPKNVMVKCPSDDEYKKMPTLSFKFGNVEIKLEPHDYVMKVVLFGNVGFMNWCHMMIRPRPDTAMYANYLLPEENKDQWILGQLLFNKACVAFNYEKTEIGVANVKGKNAGKSGDHRKSHGDNHHHQQEGKKDD